MEYENQQVKYDLRNDWAVDGYDFDTFKERVYELSAITRETKVAMKDLAFVSYQGEAITQKGIPVARFRKLLPDNIDSFEKVGSINSSSCNYAAFSMRDDNRELLEEEARDVHMHIIVAGNHPELSPHLYLSAWAMDQLLEKIGIKGGSISSEPSLARDLLVAAAAAENGDVKLITRSVDVGGNRLEKVFGIVSPRCELPTTYAIA